MRIFNIQYCPTDEFEELGKTDPLYRELDRIVKDNGGLWCAEAEKYLLENGPKL